MKTETEESLRSSVNYENRDGKSPYILVWTMKTEMEEYLNSSVSYENGDGRILTFLCKLWKWRRKNAYLLVWTIKTETEESLRSSVNHENEDGSTAACSTEVETEGTDRSFSVASVQLTSQTSKCEPVMAETETERYM